MDVSYIEFMTHAEVRTTQTPPAQGACKPPVQADTQMYDDSSADTWQ